MKLYALGDIHGCLKELKEVMKYIKLNKDDKIIFLGDYIDRGPDSKACLEYIKDLQENNKESIIVLKGNHEFYFEEFLTKDIEWHLGIDPLFKTTYSFFDKEEIEEIEEYFSHASKKEIEKIVRDKMMENKELINWMINLPYYYETDKQIFVHAGIEEEADDLWMHATPDYMFVEKYPHTIGSFYKDIIAGHIATSTIANDDNYHNIYYDNYSHFYCDGSTPYTSKLPILIYDSNKDEYSSLLDGEINIIER